MMFLFQHQIEGRCYLSCGKVGFIFMSVVDSYIITRVIEKKMKEKMLRTPFMLEPLRENVYNVIG